MKIIYTPKQMQTSNQQSILIIIKQQQAIALGLRRLK